MARRLSQPINCASCGRYVPLSDMEAGGPGRFEYEPLSDFGPERAEWICGPCNHKERPDA